MQPPGPKVGQLPDPSLQPVFCCDSETGFCRPRSGNCPTLHCNLRTVTPSLLVYSRPRSGNCPTLHCNNLIVNVSSLSLVPKVGQLPDPSLQPRRRRRRRRGRGAQGRAIARPFIATISLNPDLTSVPTPRSGNCPTLHCNGHYGFFDDLLQPKVGQLPDPSLQPLAEVHTHRVLRAQGRAIARPFIATTITPFASTTASVPRSGNCPTLHCNFELACATFEGGTAQGRAIARPFIATRRRRCPRRCSNRPKVGQLPDPSLQRTLLSLLSFVGPRSGNCPTLHCNIGAPSPFIYVMVPKVGQLPDPSLQLRHASAAGHMSVIPRSGNCPTLHCNSCVD